MLSGGIVLYFDCNANWNISSHFTSSHTELEFCRSTVTLIRTQHHTFLSAPFVCGVRTGQRIYQINMRVCTDSGRRWAYVSWTFDDFDPLIIIMVSSYGFFSSHKNSISMTNYRYTMKFYVIGFMEFGPFFFGTTQKTPWFKFYRNHFSENSFKRILSFICVFSLCLAKWSNCFLLQFQSHTVRHFVIMTHLVFLVLLSLFLRNSHERKKTFDPSLSVHVFAVYAYICIGCVKAVSPDENTVDWKNNGSYIAPCVTVWGFVFHFRSPLYGSLSLGRLAIVISIHRLLHVQEPFAWVLSVASAHFKRLFSFCLCIWRA